MNKYLLIAIGVLFGGCVIFYNLWDDTKIKLEQMKAEKVILEKEIERRNENEKALSKRISELTKLSVKYSDYFNTPLPDELSSRLSSTCKACK